MKIYVGKRIEGAGALVTVTDDKGTRMLDPRHDLRNHSPNGFEWGYGGSGPGQLALALCADALGDDARSLRVYQDFKWRMLAPIDGEDFSMTEERVRREIEDIELDYDHEDHLAEQGRAGEPGKADV